MKFEAARTIADAIMLEGYALYPYRASSRKNQFRWTFGLLAPRSWCEAGGCEDWWAETQCLLRPAGGPKAAPSHTTGSAAKLDVKLRFLQIERRVVEEAIGDGRFRAVDSLEVDGRLFLKWEEGVLREIDRPDVPVGVTGPELVVPFEAPATSWSEEILDASGRARGRVTRRALPLSGNLRIRFDAAGDLVRVSVRVENVTAWSELSVERDEIVTASCAAAHLLLAVAGGGFVSLLDPPEPAREAARACKNVRMYPVLVGPPASDDVVLSAPIILYDHPHVAPESPGDFFDATEIDELLTLRTSTLTDREKQEARATDPRAAAVLDRVDAMPLEARQRLHGAIRDLERAEMRPRTRPGPGHRVRLRPNELRRTDAQDMLFVGCVATVEKVMTDVDGQELLAVTLDEDPAADLHRSYGRFHYYYLDEVDLISGDEA
jgi:hypothetical protein